MQVNNISNVHSNIGFQAQIPSRLRNKMFNEAYSLGHEATDAFVKQCKNIENWGYDTSAIIQELGPKMKVEGISLVNSYLVPFQKAPLPFKNSLLESFMALKEKDILEAQKVLKI